MTKSCASWVHFQTTQPPCGACCNIAGYLEHHQDRVHTQSHGTNINPMTLLNSSKLCAQTSDTRHLNQLTTLEQHCGSGPTFHTPVVRTRSARMTPKQHVQSGISLPQPRHSSSAAACIPPPPPSCCIPGVNKYALDPGKLSTCVLHQLSSVLLQPGRPSVSSHRIQRH